MADFFIVFLKNELKLLCLFPGTMILCGLLVWLSARAVLHLFCGNRVFHITAAIGTPVHELGHALFCPIFGHRIDKLRLWSPSAEDGLYGYVNHSYSRRSLWANLGNLFISAGPIFSGMGVVVLTLILCYPAQWEAFFAAIGQIGEPEEILKTLPRHLGMLIASVPSAFSEHPVLACIGLVVMLSVALHISLSVQDIKTSGTGLLIYVLLSLPVTALLMLFGLTDAVHGFLVRGICLMLSLFSLVLALCLVWIVVALLFRLLRKLICGR